MTIDDQKAVDDQDILVNQGFYCDDFADDGEIELLRAAAERRIYWESQEFLLQEILESYKSSGSKLREHIRRTIETSMHSNICNCSDQYIGGYCIKCLRRTSVDQLCSKGFSAFLRTSKWKRTQKIPGGGSHEYIEVIVSTETRKKQIPFLVEIGFMDEFKMAKACKEYNRLVELLPEIYIGKVDHLNAIIRLVCESARKSMEEQNMHMGPWRKINFMQMKWSASSEKKSLEPTSTLGLTFQFPTVTVRVG